MLDTIKLGKLAANQRATIRRGRAGRLVRGSKIQAHIHAAGQSKAVPGVFSYPKGEAL